MGTFGTNANMLYVDTRWTGLSGIGRFSEEVLRRFELPYRPFPGQGSPSSATDIVNIHRIALQKSSLLYSPGYNAGISAARQLLTVHDLIHFTEAGLAGSLKRTYYERFVRPAIRRAGVVLTVSATSGQALEEWLDDDQVRVVDVGNGCSEEFHRVGKRASQVQDYFLFVGNLKEHKNFGVVLRVLQRNAYLRVKAVLSDTEKARQLASAHGVAEQIDFVSGLTDASLAQLYRDASGLIMPSILEGFGLPAVESLAAGTPVIYWKGCASVKEIVGNFGIAVEEAEDGQCWEEAMAHLLDHRDEIELPGVEWQRRYSWDHVAGRTQQVITEMEAM